MTESEILIETSGALGRIRLNRPKAINSLTLAMVKSIVAALARFESDPDIGAVLVTGEGERGLCAGGDIRALYDHGRTTGFGAEFFRAEYRMNARIAAYPKPYIAIMDGITMGGGVGIASHGRVRIVTERTRMAMPETGIGFFPDVGGTWLLSHAPGEIGTFMGLTGDTFGGADAIYAGFADCFVQSAALPALVTELTTLPASSSVKNVFEIMAPFTQHVAAPLAAHRAEIDAAFAHDRVEAIVAALQRSESPFALKTLAVLAQKSPTSMKLTLRLLRLARTDQRLEQSLQREFIAVHQVLASDDFYEGVRAAVVDKDRNPKWRPATLAEVTPEIQAPYFAAAPEPLF
jgi:enoyl-CoA hydratase